MRYQPEGGKSGAWHDEELDKMMEGVFTSTNVEERKEQYDKIFKRMYEVAMYVPLLPQ